MEQPSGKRKCLRRISAQYYVSAEDHVDNEVKHERLLTETSKLSSSWASLRLNSDKTYSDENTSSHSSASSSPAVHRPSSFSGPLVISVTCSSSSVNTGVNSYIPPGSPSGTSISNSCHPSPCASPVSSRVQCYSPGIGVIGCVKKAGSNGAASPLFVSAAKGRKRMFPQYSSVGNSSAEISRESSPDLNNKPKNPRITDVPGSSAVCLTNTDNVPLRWPPSSPNFSHSLSNFSMSGNAPSSPSTVSLPSPRLSISCTSNNNTSSPSSSQSNNNNLNDAENLVSEFNKSKDDNDQIKSPLTEKKSDP